LPPVEPVRLLLLTAMLYNPPILIGYLLYVYGPSKTCIAGPICKFGTYPGFLQIVLLLAGAWLLWLLIAVGVRRVLEWPGGQGWLASALRGISDYESVRELLGVLGALLLVAMVFALLGHRLTWTSLILGAITAGAAIRAAFFRNDLVVVAAQPAPAAGMTYIPPATGTTYASPASQPRVAFAPSMPYGASASRSRPLPYDPYAVSPASPTPSGPFAPSTPSTPAVPPEFVPPPELLAPPDATQPSRWEGEREI
jgi:hypothetical protein